jgi:MFS family permease
LFSKRRTQDLLSAFAGNFAQFGARVIISPFVLSTAGTFAVTKTDIGLVLIILWATFAFLQFPSGILADRYGEKSIMLLALGATTVGSVLVATAPGFRVCIVAAVTLGGGAGLYFSVGSSLISKRYEQEEGRALSIHSAGGPVAGLLLPVAATWVATQYTWRAGVAIGAAVSILAFVGISVAFRRTPVVDPSLKLLGSLHPRTALSLLTRPSVLFTTVVATAGDVRLPVDHLLLSDFSSGVPWIR